MSKRILHIIPHTHWDLEWYFSAERFQVRLVRLVDALIDLLEHDKAYRHFMFDGQIAPLEGYLAICPDREEALRHLVSTGRLAVGPWYVQPDEFLVAGESLVRNLLVGTRAARDLGGGMEIGYLPDSFGHASQIPQILQGFGIRRAVVWRGVSGGPRRLPAEFLWESPNGSRVLVVRLPEAWGYSSGSSIPVELKEAREFLERRSSELRRLSRSRSLLLLNGSDHGEPEPHLTTIIGGLNHRVGETELRITSLAEYFDELEKELSPTGQSRTEEYEARGDPAGTSSDPHCVAPPLLQGELRDTNRTRSGRYNYLLPGVASARIPLKQLHHRAETLLTRWTEPLCSLALLQGDAYPQDLLRYAWKKLLRNQAHDSIGGCAVDEVASAMSARLAQVCELAESLADDAARYVASSLQPAAPHGAAAWIVVFNALASPRTALVEVVAICDPDTRRSDLTLTAPDGSVVAFDVLHETERHVVPDRRGVWPPGAAGARRVLRLQFIATEVPGLGLTTYRLDRVAHAPAEGEGQRDADAAVLENDYLRAKINADGTFDVTHKGSGREFVGLHQFEDGGDVGDCYTYAPPDGDWCASSVGKEADIECLRHSDVATVYRITLTLLVPRSAGLSRRRRSVIHVPLHIRSTVTLATDSPWLSVRTEIDNRAEDHRLRVLFPTGIVATSATAGCPFGAVSRPVRPRKPAKTTWIEDPPRTHPCTGFIDVSDSRTGLAILVRGLLEYEVIDRRDRAVALTLMRSVGYLGAPQPLSTIRSPAGPPLPTPAAQCPGHHVFEYAIYPHPGDRIRGGVDHQSDAFRVALRGIATERDSSGQQGQAETAPRAGFLTVEPESLQLAALKRSEDRETLLLRLYNPTEEPVQGRLAARSCWAAVFRCRLDETREEQLASVSRELVFRVRGGEILTLELQPLSS